MSSEFLRRRPDADFEVALSRTRFAAVPDARDDNFLTLRIERKAHNIARAAERDDQIAQALNARRFRSIGVGRKRLDCLHDAGNGALCGGRVFAGEKCAQPREIAGGSARNNNFTIYAASGRAIPAACPSSASTPSLHPTARLRACA